MIEITGAVLVIGSATIAGIYVSVIERTIACLETKASNIDKQLDKAREAITRSYQFYEPALIKIVILQSTHASQSVLSSWMPEIAKSIVQGLLHRYNAATGEGPSDEQFRVYKQTADRAFLKNDAQASAALSEISADLMSKWAERHTSLVSKRNEINAEAVQRKRKSVGARHLAVTMQILGLIAVLLKDKF